MAINVMKHIVHKWGGQYLINFMKVLDPPICWPKQNKPAKLLEDTQLGYVLQKYTLDKYTLERAFKPSNTFSSI